MPTLGVVRTANANGAVSASTNIFVQPIEAADVPGGTLTQIESFIRDFGTAFYRVGIYQGGTISDCSAATLLWDSGKVDANGLSSGGEWDPVAISDVAFAAGEVLWIAIIESGSASPFRAPSDGSEDGDLHGVYYNTNLASNPDTAMPATLAGATTTAINSDALKFILTYTAGGSQSIVPIILSMDPFNGGAAL